MTTLTNRFRSVFACMAITLTIAGTAPADAQTSPPTPPESPRPPRPPRSSSRWFRWDGGSGTGVAKIDTLVPFSGNGSVELGLISGSIKVSAWNRGQVRVVASAIGNASLDFDATGSHVDLGVRMGMKHNRSEDGTATYDVTVPAGARVTLSAISGSITVAGVRGGIDANSVSGSVDVRDAAANVAIESVSGNVTASGVAGDVKAETVSGRLEVANVSGTVSAGDVSGSIDLSNLRGTRVRANSVSGDVIFAGALNPAGRYGFETHSGRTVLNLQSGASAAITVNTYSGSVANDYPGAVRRPENDADDERTIYRYTIGRGDARVSIDTFSGRVQISQGNH
ncbi:MAG: DUF4097 family beta strand repeat-containing protein [Gemmatimonadaceae bacterium]